jgi:trans-aconitate methyltransferase
VFAAAAAAAPDARRILSFGCSSGEECVTLAEYFPKAEIIGADINPVILLQARKHRSDRIRFVYAGDRILSGLGGFDAIFCMAVLRSAGHYPFEIYEERALFLETLLRPGGLLVIHNSPYRFGDTARKDSYETCPWTHHGTSARSFPTASPKRSPTAASFASSSLRGPTAGTKPATRPTAPARLELSRG